jgi:hypothetical protein
MPKNWNVKALDEKGQWVRIGVAVELDAESIGLTIGQMQAVPASAPVAASAPVSAGPTPTTFPNYGRSKNEPIAGAARDTLDYYAAGARRSIADPAKERFRAKEQALLSAIEAEIARQGSGPAKEERPRPSFLDPQPSMFTNDTPPPPGDDDIPF